MGDIVLSQLMDPFRIGLIFFLLLTALRTRANMGLWMPLAMGVVFIAILIPLTTAAASTVNRFEAIGLGIVSNGLILGVMLAGWSIARKIRH
ncbi:hypothetical protein ASE36_06005 [Rhizobium sp. Root274]|uniref:hypothetical protein n=1 Tax=unclassified Rhizobium TaxID=2613769 RepID=UPI0007128D4F|nr:MULTISPECIES: hypothetical protein [unclassified Rhizobium]KQW31776.1 hypothetical protein ASC71_06010 [Rhizobium sp. Root1240]KRD33316.1 hypothetical protein ASE36_06005 [Rhizobium sp. Root274]